MAALMVWSPPGLHVHVLDHVAEVSGGVPEGLRSLGFADPVEGADHQAVLAGPGGVQAADHSRNE